MTDPQSQTLEGDFDIEPYGHIANLSPVVQARLIERFEAKGEDIEIIRRALLAVLYAGSVSDDAKALFDRHNDFAAHLVQRGDELIIRLSNPPASAFRRRRLIEGARRGLSAVLRDLALAGTVVRGDEISDPDRSHERVYRLIEKAGLFNVGDERLDRIVCWGGHSIAREEYEYSKLVGHELGLDGGTSVITGCGPGIMKGPMKGASIAHHKQQIHNGRFIGFTEPGIITAEPPNPIVDHLVVFGNIEQRLEGFVRATDGIFVFPGGVGTAEEIQYILSILLHNPDAKNSLPLIFTGPEGSAGYFEALERFLQACFGEATTGLYEVIIGDHRRAAERMKDRVAQARAIRRGEHRRTHFRTEDELDIPLYLRTPFEPTHETMAGLRLEPEEHEDLAGFAAEVRRLFSGIVAGNLKPGVLEQINQRGRFSIRCPPSLAEATDALLRDFVAQGRMKIGGGYKPCYEVVARS